MPEQAPKSEAIIEIASLSEQSRLVLVEDHQQNAPPTSNNSTINRTANLANQFLRLAELATFPLDRLSRYGYLLWRRARQLVFTLETLRRHKSLPRRSTFPFPFRRREPGDSSEGFR